MSTHVYTAGARTRNVVNIANPGSETAKAYSVTKDNKSTEMAAPTAAIDGFKNFRGQKTLHILIHNNAMQDASAGAVNISANKIIVYVYKSALGGTASWAPLRIPIHNNASGVLQFPTVKIPDAIDKNTKYHMVVPIEGAERVAVVLDSSPFSATFDGTGTLDVYLGVNSI